MSNYIPLFDIDVITHSCHNPDAAITNLYLIPEEEVALAELELLHIEQLGSRQAHAVHAGKDPTSAGGTLIAQRFDFIDL